MTGRAPALSAVDAFEEAGFAVVPGALDPALRAALREGAERLLASTESRGRDRGADGKDGFRECVALDPDTFLPLLDNPAVLPTVVRLLSPNIHVLSSHLIALPATVPGRPRTVRTPQRPGWHRDMFGVDADLGTDRTPRLAVKCAYYLTDPVAGSGVTMFLPGSHLLREPPPIPAGEIDPPGAVTPDLHADGCDAVLFENRTYHAGGLNRSGRPRLAVMVQYGYRWLAPVDDPAPELRVRPGITAIQRQLLGAPDRRPDGSLAKGAGAAPLRRAASPRDEPAPRKGPAMPPAPEELFRSTARYYAEHRAGYPARMFDDLARLLHLDRTRTALDLGCGTGQIAVPLSARVGLVIAVDPEPAMLEEGARVARERGGGEIRWRRGDSFHLADLDLPPLDLVTIGAAFHWTDREQTLADLDRLVVPGGAVVVASGGAPATKRVAPWEDVVAAVRTRYLGPERRAGSGTYSHPAEDHATVLRRSAFSDVTVQEWDWSLERDVESVVGLQFSYSYSAPALFADERERSAFEQELRDVLTAGFPEGRVREEIRTEAIIGRRPGP